MLNLYQVKLLTLSKNVVKSSGKKMGRPTWDEDSTILNVLANGDAMKAVKKAQRSVMGESFTWDDDKDRVIVNTVIRTRLVSVEKINTVDVR